MCIADNLTVIISQNQPLKIKKSDNLDKFIYMKAISMLI